MTTTPSDSSSDNAGGTGLGNASGGDAQGQRVEGSGQSPTVSEDRTLGVEQYGLVGRPTDNAKKAEWVTYAQSQGATLTGKEKKDELIKKYGK